MLVNDHKHGDVAAKYFPLVEAAGLGTADMSSFDVFILAGHLLDDPVVDARAVAMGFEPGTSIMLATLEDRVEIIKSMTAEEKAALRERISAVKI